MNRNPYYNNEGYPDPTAYYGTKDVIKEDAELERKTGELIKVLKFIIRFYSFTILFKILPYLFTYLPMSPFLEL